VYCKAPVAKGISFQLIDENGMAIQLMRSLTYAHPGEQMSCLGCHENKWKAVPDLPGTPQAFLRPPSEITPEVGGLEPINFHRIVEPVLQNKCVSCHQGQAPNMSYESLKDYAWWSSGSARDVGPNIWYDALMVSNCGGSRSLPMVHGAYGSRICKSGGLSNTHTDRVTLSEEERRRITMWLDCNSNELGAYCDVDAQKNGEVVWPRFDVDQENLQGVENRVESNAVVMRSALTRPAFSMQLTPQNIFLSFKTKGNYTVSMIDMSGAVIRTMRCTDARHMNLSRGGIASGVYMVSVKNAASSMNKKVCLVSR
jgi:hypothetical protein